MTNPSSRTMALGSKHALTEISTTGNSWGWRRPFCTIFNLATFMCRLAINSGILSPLETQELVQYSKGIDLPTSYVVEENCTGSFSGNTIQSKCVTTGAHLSVSVTAKTEGNASRRTSNPKFQRIFSCLLMTV